MAFSILLRACRFPSAGPQRASQVREPMSPAGLSFHFLRLRSAWGALLLAVRTARVVGSWHLRRLTSMCVLSVPGCVLCCEIQCGIGPATSAFLWLALTRYSLPCICLYPSSGESSCGRHGVRAMCPHPSRQPLPSCCCVHAVCTESITPVSGSVSQCICLSFWFSGLFALLPPVARASATSAPCLVSAVQSCLLVSDGG